MTELLTPPEVTRLLTEFGLAPRKAAGQNFVVDPNTVRKIVREAGVGPGATVLEIGPGLGSLTRGLLEVAGRVVAVEIDAGMVRALQATIGGARNLELVHANALEVDLGALVDGGPAVVVANLPYNVATPLLAHVVAAGAAFPSAYVMVQREVGERWAASVGHPLYAGISVRLALVADVAVASRISRQVFLPVPNVDSVMVRVTRRDDVPDPDEVARVGRVVDVAFGQRRKTLRRTLRALAEVSAIEAACATAGVDPGARPEELDVEAFRRLAAALLG